MNLEGVLAVAAGGGRGRGDLLRGRRRASSPWTTPTAQGGSPSGSAGDASDAAQAAIRIAGSFGTPEEGLRASQSARNLLAAGLEEDIAWCARESVLPGVPRLTQMLGEAAELMD